MTQSTAHLVVTDLHFSYPEYPGIAARKLFNGLNLRLPAGSMALLLARPDQGKTTLCRVLAGLIPRFSGGRLRGTARLGGVELLDSRPYDLIDQVGLVFQHPGEQLLLSRCDSEIAFALESLGVERPEIRKRLDGALRTMELERYRYDSPKVLSGGEKKKLLIACLLAVDPRLWLLDETLEELDRDTKQRLLRLLQERGRSTLVLSAKWHELFREYVQRVFILEDGTVQSIAAPMGTPEFQGVLLQRGFILPGEVRPAQKRSGGPRERSTSQGGSPEGEALLAADGLSFSYDGVNRGGMPSFSLHVDSLRLEAGRTTALVGDNGSGKSTLGRILCGLLTPARGTIRIRKNGRLEEAAAEDLNRFTGYLFQDPDLQIFLPTVFEELALGLRQLRLPAEEIERRVADAVSLFDLPATGVPPSLMSYGARKKLQAAVYYLLDRPLMIIDEGDSGLSVDDFAEMVRLFHGQRNALLFITHDSRLAEALADEVLQLRDGRFV
ncbi:MAG: ABC transporter ATP-binding protein [Spirochaetales bacterium]|nr:ABC transporter ATP-binding protein [Spirochaetales bacterium]